MRTMRFGIKPVLLLVLLLPFLTSSAAAPQFELTIDNIMRGPALVGYEPRDVRWSGDGQRIYFAWKQPTDAILAEYDTYAVNRDGTGLKKLTDDEARMAPPSGGSFSSDKSKVVYAREGDLYLYDFSTDKARRLMRTAEPESNPRFLRDGHRITFVRSSNLFVLSLDDGSISQLTDIQPGAAPGPGGQQGSRSDSTEDRKGTDSQEYIKQEQKDLLEIVRQRAQKKDDDDARRVRDNWWKKPLTLRSGQSITAMQLTPNEKYIVAMVTERGEGAIRTIVPNYISQAGYSETIPGRTKVGDTPDRSRLAVINAQTGEMKFINHGLIQPQPIADNPGQQANKDDVASRVGESQASGQQESRARTAEQRNREREVSCSLPLWSEDGTKAIIVARAADNKDEWIMAFDPATAKAKPIVAIHDDAWIGGPGTFSLSEGSGRYGGSTVGWMKDDHTIYFQSEKSGFSHLYTVPYEGGEPRQLTSGNWEVLRIWLSPDKSTFFLETNEADRGERHLYRMSAEGGERVRLTTQLGQHQTVLSRDLKHFADVYSYTTKPPEIYVQETRPDAEARKLTTSPAPEFFSRTWMDPQNLYITARDGAKIPAQLFRPAKSPAKSKKGGPAVIFVHGAGYTQAVHRGWGSYYHEYLFHNFLAEKGYTVLLLDYRASAGSGRDWRTAVYRHMGGKDLDDNVDAARWLVKEQGVDPQRIGIYGGSYGGFLTLMAMFKEPDVFAAGAAMRPVTDWAHYNHPYTSAILNNPQKDAEAYKQSSPIYFADGLKGALLICHGVVDTNVHFQDTVRLVQRLIELRKTNWSVAMYPVEDHSFVQPSSWADEYKRIFKLFEENLKPRGNS